MNCFLIRATVEPLLLDPHGENRRQQGFDSPAIDVSASDCKSAHTRATADELLWERHSHEDTPLHT
jgi:hypothetical protein